MLLLTMDPAGAKSESVRISRVTDDRRESDVIVEFIGKGHAVADIPIRKLVLTPTETLELINKLSQSLIALKVGE